MTTKIIRDELGNRRPMVEVSLDATFTDPAGNSLNGVKVYVPMVRLDASSTVVSIPGSVEISNDAGNPLPVSGSAAAGSAPTQPPLSVSGVDGGGLKRHLLTDTAGQQRVIGPVQSTASATIANGASLSGAIDLGDLRAVRLATPAAWTTAALTFQVSYDGSTWADLYDETGTEVSHTLVAGKSMRLPIHDWLGIRYFKIRSGTSASPVNQGADRVFTVVAQ